MNQLDVKTKRKEEEKARQILSVLDTETTGLGRYAEILQIAFYCELGEQSLSFYFLPKGSISREATKVHKLRRKREQDGHYALYRDRERLETCDKRQAYLHILECLVKIDQQCMKQGWTHYVCTHNGIRSDWIWLFTEMEDLALDLAPVSETNLVDTLVCVRSLMPDLPSFTNSSLYKRMVSDQDLSFHDALEDARSTSLWLRSETFCPFLPLISHYSIPLCKLRLQIRERLHYLENKDSLALLSNPHNPLSVSNLTVEKLAKKDYNYEHLELEVDQILESQLRYIPFPEIIPLRSVDKIKKTVLCNKDSLRRCFVCKQGSILLKVSSKTQKTYVSCTECKYFRWIKTEKKEERERERPVEKTILDFFPPSSSLSTLPKRKCETREKKIAKKQKS